MTPWPTSADGQGAALHRISVDAYGDFAASWNAAVPTPGSAEFGDVATPGDFNADGIVNDVDIDLLCGQMQGVDLSFDLTNDGIVDRSDVTYLVRNILGTDYGDANLDGSFNSADLIKIFQAGQYQDNIAGNSGWATGDWNCDGDFTTADLIVAFQAGSYTDAAVAVDANPESAAAVVGDFDTRESSNTSPTEDVARVTAELAVRHMPLGEQLVHDLIFDADGWQDNDMPDEEDDFKLD